MNLSKHSLLLFGLPLASLTAQVPTENWSLRLPFGNTGIAMATHPTTGRPVRFGGQNNVVGTCPFLWEWDGSAWARHSSTANPEPRQGHSLVTDELHGQLVLFGGLGAQSNDTWTWDGGHWQAHATPPLLTSRSDTAMVFDSLRGRVVLFGGGNNTLINNDTWEWNGASWTLCQPGAPPAARLGHRLAFDAARGKTILFGGRTATALLNDTWEWDGTFWIRRFPNASPVARQLHQMIYDDARQRVVLFGGAGLAPLLQLQDTWEWNGTTWAAITTPHSPPMQSILPNESLVFDRGRSRAMLFRGDSTGPQFWEYDGLDWTPSTVDFGPAQRAQTAITEDPPRANAVLFGGRASTSTYGDTWTWDGQRWHQAAPAAAPGPRFGHAIAFDAAHAAPLLFGGYSYGGSGTLAGYFDDTWTWNGTTWTEAQPGSRPQPRQGHGLAYHTQTQRIVLFGGTGASNMLFGDTWIWDGTNWTPANPTTSPQPRYAASMSGTGSDITLFGGATYTTTTSSSSPLNDTWRWNGTTWTQLQPANSPSARYFAGSAYDNGNGRMLVFSGSPTLGSSGTLGDTWAFDGTNWTQVATAISPRQRSAHALLYDARLHQLVLFGEADTWTLATARAEDTFGSGCPGTLGSPLLQSTPASLPELGGIVTASVTNLPASLAVMAMGFSNTTTGSQSLPLALALYGMPGCDLLIAPDATMLLLGQANTVTWTVPIPYSTGLFGLEFYYQAFAYDPQANVAGLTTSNAGHCRIGN